LGDAAQASTGKAQAAGRAKATRRVSSNRKRLKQQEELKHQKEKSRLQTIALAEQFRDTLLLSDAAPKGPEADNKEKAA
jgi:hypothetical protein